MGCGSSVISPIGITTKKRLEKEKKIKEVGEKKTGIEYLETEESKNETKNYYELGMNYLNGDGGKSCDPKTGIENLFMAGDDNRALLQIGNCFLNGIGVGVDVKVGLKYLKKSANMGNLEALYSLGIIYLHGEIAQKNKKASTNFLYRAYLGEHQKATREVNDLIQLQETGKNYFQNSFEMFKMAKENENKEAIYALAICYQYGEGCEKDEIKAIEMFKKAADLNDPRAQYQMALLSINNDLKLSYLKSSANQNYLPAIQLLT
ncbi:hypothetical protein HK099_006994 [Clydaea vesicula]|uniref:Uncharacterized protein n=1 Tax=Clydaea vesicula TaxID=447962 RepID=A0AAD5XTY0_9FUNG|nr:hypothetical protein HK099_006994 [Clydaea vesicula]